MRKSGLLWMLLWVSLCHEHVARASVLAQTTNEYELFYWTVDFDNGGMSDLYRWQAGQGSELVAADVGIHAGGGVISGEWLYFSMLDPANNLNLHRIPMAGGALETVFIATGYAWPFAITPDEATLYFYHLQGACNQVYRMDTTTLHLELFLADCTTDAALSPDGNWLSATTRVAGDTVALVQFSTDGTAVEPILQSSSEFPVYHHGWAADGSILFASETARDGPGIYRVQADGTNMERLAAAHQNILWENGPQWSPDGQWVAVQWSGGNNHVYLSPTTGGEDVHPNISDSNLSYGGWRPDSQAVLIRTSHGLVLFDLAGNALAEISYTTDYETMGVWREIR